MSVFLASLLLLRSAQSQDNFQYRLYESDKISPAEFAQRRSNALASLNAGVVAFIPTNPLHQRSFDTDFQFRPNSNFWYLSGCEEEDSALLLAPDGMTIDGKTVKEILFVNDKNAGSETWTGVRMGPAIAKEILGVQMVVSNKRFAEVLSKLTQSKVATVAKPDGLSGTVKGFVEAFDKWATGKERQGDFENKLGMLRSIKSPTEIALSRRSIDATMIAHTEAIKSCEPDMREYEIRALVEYLFARNGCEAVAYGSIVGSGVNSCILHYVDSRKQIKNGDFICMDVGGEYHGYASDVTRSYPANGRFSPEQRAIYQIVLAAQEAGIKASLVGSRFNSADTAARKIVAEGLINLGIIKDAKEAGRYFMHGTSHYVGLDVHDTGDYGLLKANQIITVEPGIYIKEGSPCDKKYWNIGVRIEDCILIGNAGPENLSGKLPRRIEQIEALMALKGIGNTKEGRVISANWLDRGVYSEVENCLAENHSHKKKGISDGPRQESFATSH